MISQILDGNRLCPIGNTMFPVGRRSLVLKSVAASEAQEEFRRFIQLFDQVCQAVKFVANLATPLGFASGALEIQGVFTDWALKF